LEQGFLIGNVIVFSEKIYYHNNLHFHTALNNVNPSIKCHNTNLFWRRKSNFFKCEKLSYNCIF